MNLSILRVLWVRLFHAWQHWLLVNLHANLNLTVHPLGVKKLQCFTLTQLMDPVYQATKTPVPQSNQAIDNKIVKHWWECVNKFADSWGITVVLTGLWKVDPLSVSQEQRPGGWMTGRAELSIWCWGDRLGCSVRLDRLFWDNALTKLIFHSACHTLCSNSTRQIHLEGPRSLRKQQPLSRLLDCKSMSFATFRIDVSQRRKYAKVKACKGSH